MDERPMDVRLAEMRDDPAIDLVLDGSAVGGMLGAIFGSDVTGMPGECASCHTVSLLGTMRVYMRGPGTVIRCPACSQVVLRIAETPRGSMIDLRGIAFVRIEHPS